MKVEIFNISFSVYIVRYSLTPSTQWWKIISKNIILQTNMQTEVVLSNFDNNYND